MRCLSPHPRYGIQVFAAREEIIHDTRGAASLKALDEGVHAQFDNSGVQPHEADIALEHFAGHFGALAEGVHPLTRIGVFDTEAYCLDKYPSEAKRNDMQPQIEERLRALQEKFPSQFIIVEQPKAERPWPTYDEEYLTEFTLEFQQERCHALFKGVS